MLIFFDSLPYTLIREEPNFVIILRRTGSTPHVLLIIFIFGISMDVVAEESYKNLKSKTAGLWSPE